jgi:hypothetical protein
VKWSKISEEESQKDFENSKQSHGSELMLQGLFYSNDNIEVQRSILEQSQMIEGNDLYFSTENITHSFRKKSAGSSGDILEYCQWKSKNKKETGKREKKTWQSDGSIRSGETRDEIAIVEFKGLQNRYLRHSDIAKLVQYLIFACCEDVFVMYVCRKTFVEDIYWLVEQFDSNKIGQTFFHVCNDFTRNSYLHGPSLKKLEEKWAGERGLIAQNNLKTIDSYNPEEFYDVVKKNEKTIKEGIRKLIVVNIDKEAAEFDNKIPEIVNLGKCYSIDSLFTKSLRIFI